MKYEIIGGQLPAVVCKLDRGEKMFTESGGDVYKRQACTAVHRSRLDFFCDFLNQPLLRYAQRFKIFKG